MGPTSGCLTSGTCEPEALSLASSASAVHLMQTLGPAPARRPSIGSVKCYAPNKVRYQPLRRARAAARAQGWREYQCGDHYHLSSRPVFRVS
jgi:hypothetical protein